ncbi:phenylacetate-CoA oxygenase subunit PaaC [Pontibacter mangrovi]|uniref:Phenylacetate-CoA oxygenase subunit PaaC n=2 Tax=Pontibacter mangrovi TaxID=2589816 RepID=A0A501W827_9BACT|nr:phenylacetate-CoA oxygenase subunit PaaC [Pontibacter mangrovi]
MDHHTQPAHVLHELQFKTPLQEYSPEVRQLVFDYTLQLADTSLILSHRLAEWCGHGPILEQDMAMTNISLDLLGEARNLYQYAAELEGKGHTEDDLAYLRDAVAYKNPLLVEQPNGNFGDTVLRQFIFDTFHYFFLKELQNSTDHRLAAIAEKSLKEASYHIKWSSEWVIRLGDGTEESKKRMEAAIDELWTYSGELFEATPTEKALQELDIIPDYTSIKAEWDKHVAQVLQEATLALPQDQWMQSGGKYGRHSEHLGYILSDLQYLQRTYPGQKW